MQLKILYVFAFSLFVSANGKKAFLFFILHFSLVSAAAN